MATQDKTTLPTPLDTTSVPSESAAIANAQPPLATDNRAEFAKKYGKSYFNAKYIRARLDDIKLEKPETLALFLDEFASNDTVRRAMTKEIEAF